MIPFPDLHRTDKMELPRVMVISFAFAAIAIPFSLFVGIILLIPAILVVLYEMFAGVTNSMKRWSFTGSFDGRLSARRAQKRIQQSPDRFVVYVQYYSGGFDVTPLAPLAVLEDIVDGKRFGIFPSSWKIITYCKNHHVTILDGEGCKLPN